MDQDELDRIHAERGGYFTFAWFGKLLRGHLSLGDTFWIGNYGIALVTIPASFLIALIVRMVSERGFLIAMVGVSALFALYHLALTRAVWSSARRTPGRGVWRWIGLLLTALNAAMALLLMANWAETLGAL